MEHEFITIHGIDDDIHEWTYYTDELLGVLYTNYVMSKVHYMGSVGEFKLGVL